VERANHSVRPKPHQSDRYCKLGGRHVAT
jgi:hypothetical protein